MIVIIFSYINENLNRVFLSRMLKCFVAYIGENLNSSVSSLHVVELGILRGKVAAGGHTNGNGWEQWL